MNGNPYGYGYQPPYGYVPQPYPPKKSVGGVIAGIFLGLVYPLIHIVMMYAVQLTVIAGMTVTLSWGAEKPDAGAVAETITEKLTPMLEMLSAISNILTVITVILIYYFIMRAKRREGRAATPYRDYFSLKPVSPWLLLKIALMTLFLYFAVSGFLFLVELAFPGLVEDYVNASETIDGSTNWVWSFVATVIMAPLCEELIYRNRAVSAMKEVLSPVWAVVITSIVFGLVHGSFLWILYAAALGSMFGFLYIRSDSIYPSLVAHFVFNLIGYGHSLLTDAIRENEAAIANFNRIAVILMLSSLVGAPLTVIQVFKSMPKPKSETKEETSPTGEQGTDQHNAYGYQPPYGTSNPYGNQPPYGEPNGYASPPNGRWVFYPGFGWYFLPMPTPSPVKTPEKQVTATKDDEAEENDMKPIATPPTDTEKNSTTPDEA